MKVEKLTKEVDWFCLHMVQSGLMSKEECVAILDALEANDDVLSGSGVEQIDIFIQVMQDNQLGGEDYEQIENMRREAKEESRAFGFPSHGLFIEERTKQNSALAADVGNIDEARERVMAFPVRNKAGEEVERHTDAVTEKPWDAEEEDLDVWDGTVPIGFDGWPNLAQVEGKSKEETQAVVAEFLRYARRARCSDVHFSAGSRPFVRQYSFLHVLEDQPLLSEDLTRHICLSLLTETQAESFIANQDIDFCYAVTEKERYRGNLLEHKNGISGSFRVVNSKIPGIRQLGFLNPEVVEKLTTYTQGLILLTGPASCGKTTTMNAMLNFINLNRHDHIITVEDPIENVIPSVNCNVTQRQLGDHTKSYAAALRGALREDPDIIAIGEMRDLETISMAIRAAETGHLVFGTLHTSSAAATMDRILDVFPPNQQSQVRSMVSESIRGVICQQMFPNKDNTGLVMASEIMLGTLAIGNLIREGKTHQLNSNMQIARNQGMCTMEQCLVELYLAGKRSYEQTLPSISTPGLIKQMQANEAEKFANQYGVNVKKR